MEGGNRGKPYNVDIDCAENRKYVVQYVSWINSKMLRVKETNETEKMSRTLKKERTHQEQPKWCYIQQ